MGTIYIDEPGGARYEGDPPKPLPEPDPDDVAEAEALLRRLITEQGDPGTITP